MLARGKRLRGTWADPFGRTAERRAERAVRDEYVDTIEALCRTLTAETLEVATEIADLPRGIRG